MDTSADPPRVSVGALLPAPTGNNSTKITRTSFPAWMENYKAFLMTGRSSCHLPATSQPFY